MTTKHPNQTVPIPVMPNKTVEMTIGQNTYTVNFPNTGQFIDIMGLKGKIASDNYHILEQSGDSHAGYARLLCDMIAVYNILIPSLKVDLQVNAILALDMLQSRQLLDPYIETWLPFYNTWMDLITKAKTTEEPQANA